VTASGAAALKAAAASPRRFKAQADALGVIHVSGQECLASGSATAASLGPSSVETENGSTFRGGRFSFVGSRRICGLPENRARCTAPGTRSGQRDTPAASPGGRAQPVRLRRFPGAETRDYQIAPTPSARGVQTYVAGNLEPVGRVAKNAMSLRGAPNDWQRPFQNESGAIPALYPVRW